MSKVTVVSRPNRITIASKGVQGPPGDVTPELLEARDTAVQAAIDAAGHADSAQDASDEALGAASAASGSASAAAASANLAEQARLLGATIGFATKADLDASLAHPAGTLALVTNDATAENNGAYRKTGASGSGVWVQSADRVSGLEGRVSTVEASGAVQLPDDLTDAGMREYVGAGPKYPIVTDQDRGMLLGYDSSKKKLFGEGLLSDEAATELAQAEMDRLGQGKYVGAGPLYPIVLGKNNEVILGYNADTQKLLGAALGAPAGDDRISASINHMLFYGQSLSVGARGVPALSTTQPYSNLTFGGGPRAASANFSSFKPLVEDVVSPAPDGGTNRGETPCSGAANMASKLAIEESGVTDHVILASTAGRGGYTIAQLEKGSSWYQQPIAHVAGAFALEPDYSLQALCWLQGENDISLATPRATYREKLKQLRDDLAADALAITESSHPTRLITYQMSYGARNHKDIALAQLDLCKRGDAIMATPCYHLPFADDNVHLTSAGYKWIGAYFGRAYKQAVIDGVSPDWLEPLVAMVSGNVVTIRFRVPAAPLVLDTSALTATTDHGFRVVDSLGTVVISNVAVGSDTVTLTLGTAPVGAAAVRYALDYLGVGVNISGGASGNLRDSTADAAMIAGVSRPLFHVCPHFELALTTPQEI